MRLASGWARMVPLLHWARTYDRATFLHDLLGAAIVSFMFLPQSLAYALLAGLPITAGIYASILPLIGYVLFGTSRFMAVGPVAVLSLLTASALAPHAAAGSPEYVTMALTLALMSGIVLTLMGLFRMGFISNFLSYPVVSGFVTASAVLIAVSQFKTVLGIETHGSTLLELLPQLYEKLPELHGPTALLGSTAIIFLILMRNGLARLLTGFGVKPKVATALARMGPLIAAAVATAEVLALDLEKAGVKTVGALPSGLPPFTLPYFSGEVWRDLMFSAVLISLIGFIESISVAQTFAAKHRNLVLPNNELVGLGASNIIAAFCGAFPVTGGFSRSAVNYDAGVKTPIASLLTGAGIALVITFLGGFIAHVPQAVLAATIIVAVMSMADLKVLSQTWNYSKPDFAAAAATIGMTLLEGVEIGLLSGIVLSVGLFLYRTSRPHVAVVGLVPDTEHFRNVLRHDVITSPQVLSVRIDESLYFANARFLEERLVELLLEKPQVKHLVLICSAVNDIDASALESLEALNQRLKDMGVTFHLSEVKGPVMDRLRKSRLLDQLTGKVFMSQFLAVVALDPELVKRAWAKKASESQRLKV